jgi:carbon starvation protein CstA
MIVLAILGVSVLFLFLGGWIYAPIIGRVLGERADRVTPAVAVNDGRDYVPTRTPVVFAHHYASIAGAGPIIGPVLAIYYGWGPALVWILFGGVFLGAVHDYVATHIAMREGGKNLTVIARRYVGHGAFVMMIILLVALLVLVCAAFMDLSATALTSTVPLSTLKIDRDQQLFRLSDKPLFNTTIAFKTRQDRLVFDQALSAGQVPDALMHAFGSNGVKLSPATTVTEIRAGQEWVVRDGEYRYPVAWSPDGKTLRAQARQAIIGGIASSSVIVITVFAPLIGFLYLKRKWPVWLCSLLAVGICIVSVLIGLRWPVPFEPRTWMFLIGGYVLIASGLPVWLFLQSRDFINVHMLYVGIVFLVIALIAAGVRGGGEAIQAGALPVNNWTEASSMRTLGPGWPVMFVIIACGAVSGFHSLCAGGTTCKQLGNELAGRRVGYYAMLLESFLAVCVVCCLIVGLSKPDYEVYLDPAGTGGNAILTFAMAVGQTVHVGLGLPIAAGALGAMLLLEGFLVTTLDTAIRLTRYMLEEGWGTFFARYDVFAAQEATAAAPALEVTGTGGLTTQKPTPSALSQQGPVIATRGVGRIALKLLQHYWVNSGIAVALTMILALSNGYKAIWQIFGSSNQLLAALALIVATCWLIAHHRPVWYTLAPALFMLVTSVWMLVRLLFTSYWPVLSAWPNKPALAVVDIIVLVATVAVVILALRRWAAERANGRGVLPVQP